VASSQSSPLPYIVGAIAVLGAAAIGYMQYLAKHPAEELGLTPEAKAYVRNLKLSDVQMKATESFAKQLVVEIEGRIENAGARGLDVVEVFCVFRDAYGQLVLRKRVPIVGGRMGGLKPGESKSFRLPFDEIPDSWNQTMPQLIIAGVKFSLSLSDPGKMMGRIVRHTPDRKAKKSFTLSLEVVRFLEATQKKRRAESVSAVLEEILQSVRRQHQRAAVEQTVTDYYSSLSDAEAEEQSHWGEFALAQLADHREK